MDNEFRPGSVFSQSMDVMKSNFPVMLLFGLLSYIPVGLTMVGGDSFLFTGTTFILSYILPLLLQGAMVFGVYQHLMGSRFSPGQAFAMALHRFWYLLGLALVVGILVGVGTLLLVIPGIIIQLILWVAVPAIMIERISVGDALQRSKDLTSGRLLRILGIILIMILVWGLLMVVYFMGFFAIGALSSDPEILEEDQLSMGAVLMSLPVGVLSWGLGIALQNVLVAVSYYALRRDKEGIAVEDLASVFD